MKFAKLKKNINKNLSKSEKRKFFFNPHSFFVTFLCLVFFLSCTNVLTENLEQQALQDTANLNIKITSDEGFIFFSQDYASLESLKNSRTILPSCSYSNYDFYLFYENLNSKNDSGIIEKMSFTPIDRNIGYISHSFKKQYYKLTLFALTKEISGNLGNNNSEITASMLNQNASLKASSFVDMKYEQEIYFHLKSNTLSTGKGAVELSISHLNEWEINGNFKVNCGIYSINDGNLIYPAENNVPFELRNTQGSPSSIKDKTFSSFENDTTKSTYKIPVGDYEFIVNYIECDAEGNEKKMYRYSEKITVLINQTTRADLRIPDFLDKTPAAPSMLTSAYKLPDSNTMAFYEIQFYWQDNSINENSFELELLKVDGESEEVHSELNDEVWSILNNEYTIIGNPDSNSTVISVSEDSPGISLSKGFVKFNKYLALGSRYIARIRAVNNMGKSDWNYIQFPASSQLTDNGISFDEGFSAITSEVTGDITSINLYRINYEISNGSLSATKDGTSVTNPSLVLYGSQHVTNHNSLLMFYPDGNSGNFISSMTSLTDFIKVQNASITLSFDTNSWSHWTPFSFYDTTTTITRGNPYTYKGYENITFFAHYNNENDTSKYTNYYLKPDDILVNFYKDGLPTRKITDSKTISNLNMTITDLTLENAISQNLLTLSKSKVSLVKFNINSDKKTSCSYDKFEITVKRNADLSVVLSNSFPLSDTSSDLEIGFTNESVWTPEEYTIQITVHSSDFENSSFSYNLYLKLDE